MSDRHAPPARRPDYAHADVPKWASVDAYFSDLLAPADDALRQVLANNAAAGLPAHDVSPVQGKFLALIATLARATRVLEIGTLGGYSTIWMARALPADGRVVTIERDRQHAEIAARNLVLAGVADKVDLMTGAAVDVLPTLAGPFDLIFIDADKPNNPTYLDWALKLSRPGTVIIGDNVVRGGAVADASSTDPNVLGVRSFLERLATEPGVDSTALQTVGEKGWDGFSIAIVKG